MLAAAAMPVPPSTVRVRLDGEKFSADFHSDLSLGMAHGPESFDSGPPGYCRCCCWYYETGYVAIIE